MSSAAIIIAKPASEQAQVSLNSAGNTEVIPVGENQKGIKIPKTPSEEDVRFYMNQGANRGEYVTGGYSGF